MKSKIKSKKRYIAIRDENIRLILEYYNVSVLRCNRCGITDEDFGFFDFHHINPRTKIASISSMMGHVDWNKKEIELKKCEVLCPSCHRKHHLKENKTDEKENNAREIFKINILR